jgi:hypothetical protein
MPAPGDWGGLILIGTAVNNLEGGVGQVEGLINAPTYGGDDDSHDCGTLQYVRVEYAGFAVGDTEFNSISFYSCGSQTTVDHVQSHMGSDDGLEMFGGTFDLDHIVVTGAQDDSIDIDQGFRGTAQWVFIQQDPQVGDNCFEVSTQASVFTATPHSAPRFCNATCIGSGPSGEKSKGLTLKEGAEGYWYASIITNVTNEFALLADEPTFASLDGGGVDIQNSLFFASGATPWVSGADSMDNALWQAWVLAEDNANQLTDPGLGTSWGRPDPSPSADVAGNGIVGRGCEATDYVGVVAPASADWTQDTWINYGR